MADAVKGWARTAGRRPGRAAVVATVVLAALLGTVGVLRAARSGPPTSEHLSATMEYLPGRAADVYLPGHRVHAAPVVVLVPGGGWVTADRTGLAPLAESLAEAGMVAVNVTYRAAEDGGRFPGPVRDVDCAVDFAARRAVRAGVRPTQLVVLGHSAGAQLSALAAVTAPHFHAGCPYRHVDPTGLIGLSGPYDVSALVDAARPLFGAGPAQAPAAWREGNPDSWLRAHPTEGPRLRVLLVHGDADTLVPVWFSRVFADAVRRSGRPVRLVVLPGAEHGDTYHGDRVTDLVVRWVRAMPSPEADPGRGSGT